MILLKGFVFDSNIYANMNSRKLFGVFEGLERAGCVLAKGAMIMSTNVSRKIL
jgi:hypothetical protein